MSETETQGRKHKIGGLMAWGIVAAAAATLFFGILVTPPNIPREKAYRMLCDTNLRGLGIAMLIYAADHNDQYPTANEWCDLLVRYADVYKKQFVCRGAVEKGDGGRCHYAMNPNAEPNSPADMVLLFETKGGWNQFGGPEILTFENHRGKRCNILFNDGHVEFIKPEDLDKLKWKEDEMTE